MFDVQFMDDRDLDLSAQNREIGLGEFLQAQAGDAFNEGTTTGVISNELRINDAEEQARSERPSFSDRKLPVLSKEQYEESKHYRKGIKWDEGLTEAAAQSKAMTLDKSLYRKSIMARGGNGPVRTTLGFGAALVGSLPDPINLIPFGGAATKVGTVGKAALKLGSKEIAKKGIRTTAQKVTASVVDGALGNLAASAVTRPYWEDQGVASTWHDYVMDVTMGAIMGGGMGYMGAKVGDYVGSRKEISLKDKDAMGRGLEKATMDIEDGKVVDLSEVEGVNEAITNMWAREDVKQSGHIKKLESDLIELGYSKEKARDSLIPMMAHAMEYAPHYKMDFNTFIKKNGIDGFKADTSAKGTEGIKSKDFEGSEVFNQEQKSKLIEKGSVTFETDGRNIVNLFKNADESTIVHESGHIFLKNLDELGVKSDSPDQVKADRGAMREFLGLKEGEQITRKAHEKFARGFEQYARTGEAPTMALAKTFHNFKNWLRNIYKTAKELDVELSPEIKKVYDRLLGGDGHTRFTAEKAEFGPPRLEETRTGIKTEEASDAGEIRKNSEDLETAIVEETWSEYAAGEYKGNDAHYFKDANAKIEELEVEVKMYEALPEALTLYQSVDKRAAYLAETLNISMDKAKDFLEDINIDGGHLETLGGIREASLRFAENSIDELAVKKAMIKKRAALGIRAKRKAHVLINSIIENGGTVEDGLLAMIEGKADFRTVQGAGSSVYSTYDALRKTAIKDLEQSIGEVSPEIFTRIKKEPEFTNLITMEMWQLDSNLLAVTGDTDAKAVAKVLKRIVDQSREQLNATGSNIRYLDNWSPQAHNYDDMLKAGMERWVYDALQLVDVKRTFGKNLKIKEVAQALGDTYNTLITGFKEDKTLGLEKGDKDKLAFEKNARQSGNGKNLSKRHEGARELHFKHAGAQITYNEKYGGGKNAVTGVAEYLEKAARTISLTEKLGSNPELTINLLIADYKQQIKNGDIFADATDKQRVKMITNLPSPGELGARGKRLGRAMAEATGETLITENVNISMVTTFLRNVQTVSKLGSASLSQIADVLTQVNEKFILRDDNLMNAWGETVGDYFKVMSPEKKVILDRIAVITDGILSDELNRWNAQDNPSGVMKRLIDMQFKWNGMNALTNKTKGSFALALSKDLGSYSGKRFDEMPKGYQQALKQFGNIDELKWEVMRRAKAVADENGEVYMTPDQIRHMPDEDIEELIPSKFWRSKEPSANSRDSSLSKAWNDARKYMITDKKRELELDMRRFFLEETRNSILEPDARSRRYLVQGTKRGTPTGEALRFMMQFKSFSLTAFHRILLPGRFERAGYQSGQIKRNFRDKGVIGGIAKSLPGIGNVDYDAKGIGHYTAMALVVGYMAMTAKDLAKGRTPRSTAKWSTWLEAAAQSGGAGILGDFLFAPSNRFGSSLIGTIAGPTAATFDDIHKIYSKGLTGNPDVRSNALNLVKQNIPMQSMWWARAGIDYSVMFHLREAINPGSVRRMERRIKKHADQEYMVSPSKLLGY